MANSSMGIQHQKEAFLEPLQQILRKQIFLREQIFNITPSDIDASYDDK